MHPRSSTPPSRVSALIAACGLGFCAVFAACADEPAPNDAATATAGVGGAAGTGGAAGSGSASAGASAGAGAGGMTVSGGAGGTGGAERGTAGSSPGIAGSNQGEGGSDLGSSGAGGNGAGGEAGGAASGTGGSSAGTGGSSAGSAGAAGAGTSAACGAAGKTGYAIGDVLGPLPVRDCVTGELTTLDAVCTASATWVFAAHTHCPTCKATAGFTDEVAKAVADQNVAIVHTVYDDNGTSCETWKKTYGLASYANVRVFADPGGSVFDKVKSQSYTAPSLFLRADRTITHKEHGMSKAAVLAEITKNLGP